MAEEDIAKPAFVCHLGKFHFVRMPFGLKGAPSTFQRGMDLLLQGLDFATAYIDDIVVCSERWDQHLEHLNIILEKLEKAGLTARMSKCFFGRKEVSFLGHQVGKGQIAPLKAKVKAIEAFAQPRKKKDVRAFLGMPGFYRRFLPAFAERTACLTDLLAKNNPDVVRWTPQCQESFTWIKQKLVEAPWQHPQMKAHMF